jgi:hypothetical protein
MMGKSFLESFELLLFNALDGFSGRHVVNAGWDLGNLLLTEGIIGRFSFLVGPRQSVIYAFLLMPVIEHVKEVACPSLILVVGDHSYLDSQLIKKTW